MNLCFHLGKCRSCSIGHVLGGFISESLFLYCSNIQSLCIDRGCFMLGMLPVAATDAIYIHYIYVFIYQDKLCHYPYTEY